MKKSLLFVLLCMLSFGLTFATTTNDELVDAIDEKSAEEMQEVVQELNMDVSFTSFSSCEDMRTVLEDFIKDNEESFTRGRGGWYAEDDMVFLEAEESARNMDMVGSSDGDAATDVAMAPKAAPVASQSTDFSQTNIQVKGVDEPDILKTDGDFLYYYNQAARTVSIIRSPLDIDTATIDLDELEIVSEITIPSSFQQVQLFLRENRLVILGQRRRETAYDQYLLDRSSKVDVVVYDVSDETNPELVRLSDLDGVYQDARLIDETLYVVSQLSMNRWGPIWTYIEDDEPLPIDELIPTSFDLSYTADETKQNLRLEGKDYPYQLAVEKPDCEDILYVLPDSETLEQLSTFPSFTVVRAIDISEDAETLKTTAAFGTTDTIHMSEDNLYLVGSIYLSQRSSCPPNARCIMPWIPQGQNTMLHKFALDELTLSYVDSSLVSGHPLSQYSMSENADGYFRILTKTRYPALATHFYVLNENLDLVGSVPNIEPGEEFKSSRYIGDKLYLVTFEQIDPLFVIDVADVENPEIIGELKIPGFSTYLHPYAPVSNGKQYLLGLGYDTKINQWGGVVTNGVKLDLYEIDYTDIDDDGMVGVRQVYTETYGSGGSYTEALDNPRMFVWDESRNFLVLPMILQHQETGQSCSVEYDENGEELFRNCYETTRNKTTFLGMKGIDVSFDGGIQEIFSYNYLEMFMEGDRSDKEDYYRDGEIYPWEFRQLQFRVGYLGDVMYALNNAFGHFVIPESIPLVESYLEFLSEDER